MRFTYSTNFIGVDAWATSSKIYCFISHKSQRFIIYDRMNLTNSLLRFHRKKFENSVPMLKIVTSVVLF